MEIGGPNRDRTRRFAATLKEVGSIHPISTELFI